jgi:hypothetical protein
MKDRDVMVATKVKIAETIIFPIVTYGSQTWIVRKKERKKIDAFELWKWRRILRTPWTERTNLSILEEVKLKRPLDATICQLKLRYFGHVMRTEGTLERDIMLGKVEEHRRQGRPRLHWSDSIKEATGLSLEVLKESVKDRKKWRRMVMTGTQDLQLKWAPNHMQGLVIFHIPNTIPFTRVKISTHKQKNPNTNISPGIKHRTL